MGTQKKKSANHMKEYSGNKNKTVLASNVSEEITNMAANLNPLFKSNPIPKPVLRQLSTAKYENMRHWIQKSTNEDIDDENQETNQFEFGRGAGEKSLVLCRQSMTIKKPRLDEIDEMILSNMDMDVELIGQYSFEILSDGESEETAGQMMEDEEVTVVRNRASTTDEYIAWLEESLNISNRKVNEKVRMLLKQLNSENIKMKKHIEGISESFGCPPDEEMYEAPKRIVKWV